MNQPPPKKSPTYPKKPPPEYCHELYMRMRNQEVVVEIDNDFPGMQVLVVREKRDYE